MKKLYFLLIALFIVTSTNAQIVNIPDANFKDALVNTNCVDTDGDGYGDSDADTNDDGEIQVSEAEAVLWLKVYNKNIVSLEGIESFINLEFLSCGFNQIENLDLTYNTSLKTLYCWHNQISTLEISQCQGLITLRCQFNNLNNLDLSLNIDLQTANINHNHFSSIDVSLNSNLDWLDISFNQLTSIDVSQNINLSILECGYNQLNSIDVTQNPVLYKFMCDQNLLTNLDVSQNPELGFFICFDNQLTHLDVSQNPNLWRFQCDRNNLNGLDVTQNPDLWWLSCSENQLQNLHINNGNNGALHIFGATGNPNLFCIQVDNENAPIPYCDPWTVEGWCVDPWVDFSNYCELGVEDFNVKSQIILFPNPVKDNLIIDNSSNLEVKSVKVYDLLGRLVMLVEDDLEQIDVSGLNSGVFFLRIETTDGVITKKLIKE